MTTNSTTNKPAVQDKDANGVTNKLLNKVFLRWTFLGELGWNYERMMGSGYCFSIMPLLKTVYKDDEDALQNAVRNHLQFFNTNMYTGSVILGVNCALEPELKESGAEAVAGIKTGLMGPLAGVGDSVFGVIIPTVFGSIAAYMALQGSPIGCIIWVLLGVALLALRYGLFRMGYVQGKAAVNTIAEHMKPITDAAAVLGLTVVGALVCSVVTVNAPGTFQFGEVSQSVQEMLDTIMPGLLPLAATLGTYALLSRKGMTSNKAILIIFIVGMVLGCTGLLCK